MSRTFNFPVRVNELNKIINLVDNHLIESFNHDDLINLLYKIKYVEKSDWGYLTMSKNQIKKIFLASIVDDVPDIYKKFKMFYEEFPEELPSKPIVKKIKTITRYDNCVILYNKNNVNKLGFDNSITEEEIISIAVKHKCPIICKNGINGKWYLKGQGIPYTHLEKLIDENLGSPREGVYTLFIKSL
jgi:hypothetical protein